MVRLGGKLVNVLERIRSDDAGTLQEQNELDGSNELSAHSQAWDRWFSEWLNDDTDGGGLADGDLRLD